MAAKILQMSVTADELKAILKDVQSDEAIPLIELADEWLHWFKKRGDRALKDAAKLGYNESTMDLPIEIARSLDSAALHAIQRGVRGLLVGCFVGFVEDEYDEKSIARLYISWKETKNA